MDRRRVTFTKTLLGQGARPLRRSRRLARDGRLRPDVGVRRGDGRAGAGQGADPHRDERLLVRPLAVDRARATSSHSRYDGAPADWAGRMMVVRRAEMLPIECIVRGYLAGSAWKEYRIDRNVARRSAAEPGCASPSASTRRCSRPRRRRRAGRTTRTSRSTTPSRSSAARSPSRRASSASPCTQRARRAPRRAGDHRRRHQARARVRRRPSSCSADEVLTPDSSRFWPADEWKPGVTPPAFDKQPLRDWLEAQGWDKRPPPPPLPDETSSRRAGRATSRATSASPDSTFADWPGASAGAVTQ